MVFRRGAPERQFRPAAGTPPAVVVRDWAHLVHEQLGPGWDLRASKPALVRVTDGGLRQCIDFQSNKYNRAEEAAEIITMVGIRSKKLANWRNAHEGSVVAQTAAIGGQGDVVCAIGIGYLFGSWSDGLFDLLVRGQAAACLTAVQQHAVPWFDSADDPRDFVQQSPQPVRAINAHSLIEWLLSLGEGEAAGDFARRYVGELEHAAARAAFERGRQMGADARGDGYSGSNSSEAVGWLVARHGLI